jgi:hypothetical protein
MIEETRIGSTRPTLAGYRPVPHGLSPQAEKRVKHILNIGIALGTSSSSHVKKNRAAAKAILLATPGASVDMMMRRVPGDRP